MSNPDGIPDSWVECTLGEIVEYGATEKAEPTEISDDAWVLELEDIESGTSRVVQRVTFGERKSKSTKNRFQAGDVLYGKLRPYLNKVVRADGPGFCTTEIVPISPPIGVQADYLFHWLKHPRFLSYVSGVSHGLNMPRLGTAAGQKAPIVLAPTNEQKRIVAELDELLARSRRAKQALDAVPALLDQLRQSILAAAFRGDLTADWREGKTLSSEEMLRVRHAHETLRADRSKPVRPTPADWANLPALPLGWIWEFAENVVEPGTIVTYGIVLPGKHVPGGIPYVRGQDIEGGGVLTDQLLCTTDAIAEKHNRSSLLPGDVLLCIIRHLKVAIVPPGLDQANVTQGTVRLRPSKAIHNRFLALYLSCNQAQRWMKGRYFGLAMPRINVEDAREIPVPVAPLEEQCEIVRRVEVMMQRVAEAEASASQGLTRLIELEQALVAKAFQGELVSQDPNDEPASILLERIRATRAGSATSERLQRRSRGATTSRDALDDQHSEVRAGPFEPAGQASLSDLDDQRLHDEVVEALLWLGQLDKDDAVRRIADHLRQMGRVEFERLRTDGLLYTQILEAIESAVRIGRLDRPKRGMVRVCLPDAAAYTADAWRRTLLASLGPEPVDRNNAIRAAAEWARDNMGLAFERLRSDGPISRGLRSAINSAIRRGEVVRVGAGKIARAPRPAVEVGPSQLELALEANAPLRRKR